MRSYSIIENGVLTKFDERDLVNGHFDVPEGVTTVCANAFSNMVGVTSISLPDSLTSIDDWAFAHCLYLTSIKIPEGVTSIGDWAFYGCRRLFSIEIPKGVTSIGGRAFYGCEGLTSITIPDSTTSIGELAFGACKNLTSINIPKSVTSIEQNVFNGCSGLTSITIPDSVTSIEQNVFNGCSGLTSITIPNGVTSIGKSAFCECKSLTSVTISDSVTSISDFAFYGCSSLTDINIPDSVSSMGNGVFYGCKSLTNINTTERIAQQLDLPKFVNIRTKNGTSFAGLRRLKGKDVFKYFDTAIAKTVLKRPEFEEIDSQTDLFNLMYNLGLFEKKNRKMEIKNDQGKSIKMPIAEVGFNIIQKMFALEDEGKLSTNQLHLYFQSMKPVEVNEEFLRFLSNKTNLTEIIEQEKKQNGFITRVLDWFEFRKSLTNLGGVEDSANISTTPTSEENRYKIRRYETAESGVDKVKWKTPTVELLIKEFKENKFVGVTEETKELAEYMGDFSLYEQKHFDKAVEIDQERKAKHTPDHILGEPLSQTYTESFKQYLQKTEELRNQILDEAGQVVEQQADIADNIFTYEMLAKSDKANFAMGFFTSCCATLYGAGAGAMRGMIVDNRMQPMVIRNRKGEIVAFGIVYVNKEEGYAVVNDIEVNTKYQDEQVRKAIYDKFMQGINDFATRYNEKFDPPIQIITCGISPNWYAVNEYIQSNPQSSILKAPNFADYKYAGSGSFAGDWHEEQYVLWKNEQQKKVGK